MNMSRSKPLRALVLVCASLAMIGSAQAEGRGYGGHGWGGGGHYYRGGGHGWGWGGVGLGVGLGVGVGLGLSSYYGAPWYDPGYVVVDPGVTYVQSQPVPVSPQPAYSQSAYSAQPIIYPRNGQSASQMDADSNSCSEWAGKQANATADPNVFRRGITACMDARGYTVR